MTNALSPNKKRERTSIILVLVLAFLMSSGGHFAAFRVQGKDTAHAPHYTTKDILKESPVSR